MMLKFLSRPLTTLFLLTLLSSAHAEATKMSPASKRIVSLGGAITEIVYALGVDNLLVGVDSSSQWPAAAKSLPQVGYVRALSAEGVLSLDPQQIILSDHAGPPQVIKQLRESGVEFTSVKTHYTLDGIRDKITAIANAVSRPERGAELIALINTQNNVLQQRLKNRSERPRVALILGLTQGRLNAAGHNTAGEAMISLAGGVNVFSAFDGYKPVSHEAMIAAQPDVIIVTSRVVDAMNGMTSVHNMPALSATPAGKNGRIVTMDTLYLLGFGPRAVQAALDLANHLHPAD